jgi:hypothetical protein
MPTKWAVVLACLAIAAVLIERSRVVYHRSGTVAQVAAESAVPPCPVAATPGEIDLQQTDGPSVAQPGGIDPMGASRAIRNVLQNCP